MSGIVKQETRDPETVTHASGEKVGLLGLLWLRGAESEDFCGFSWRVGRNPRPDCTATAVTHRDERYPVPWPCMWRQPINPGECLAVPAVAEVTRRSLQR